MNIPFRIAAALLALLFQAATAEAALLSYTDFDEFLSGLSGTPTSETFEGIPAGTTILSGDSLGNITFTYDIDGLKLVISDTFDQTTPDGHNYLGVDDGLSQVFLSGDSFTMTFAQAVHAIGLFIIGSPGDIWAGDLGLTVNGTTVFNVDTPLYSLPDLGDVFFLGLVETDSNSGFTSATLTSFDPNAEGLFEFNVDDIYTATSSAVPDSSPVPEPSSLALLLLGSAGVLPAIRRKLA